MRLVVDTNRIIAALIKNSTSRQILLSDKFEFLTVGISKLEIQRYKLDILESAGIDEETFNDIFMRLYSKISIVNDLTVESKFNDAKIIMDKIDPKDTPFIALALSLKNDGIWSDDKHFEKQDKIKIWKTDDLIKFL